MADIKWSPDGKQMFEKLMGAVPEAMRDAVKPMLLEKLAGRAVGKAVTQDIVRYPWFRRICQSLKKAHLWKPWGLRKNP